MQGRLDHYLKSQVEAGKIPLLKHGEEPPGRRLPADQNSYGRWEGARSWCTQHGSVFCLWHEGRPTLAENVRLPAGNRGRAEYPILAPARLWRRAGGEDLLPPEGWIYGDVQLSPADAVIVDAPRQPTPAQPVNWGYPDLEVDLLASEEMRGLCLDHPIASALYDLLKYTTFRKNREGIWHCTMRSAGRITADLRNRGEYYVDYFSAHTPPSTDYDRHTVAGAVLELGWDVLPRDEFEQIERNAKARFLEFRKRPVGNAPFFYRARYRPENAVASTRIGALLRELHELAMLQRLSLEEWTACHDYLAGRVSELTF